jgi:ADP-ribosylglycohydrolase
MYRNKLQRYMVDQLSVELVNKFNKNLILDKKKLSKKNETVYVNIRDKVYYNLMLHALGDTIGYNNGRWEFLKSTQEIIMQFINYGGITGIDITTWKVSDDTIMNLALFRVLLDNFKTIDEFGDLLAKEFLKIEKKMEDIHPGKRTSDSLRIIRQGTNWKNIPYDENAKGNGAAMRTQPIGLFYPGNFNRYTLIALSVEASRITHNSSIGILSGFTSALFTAFCVEALPLFLWIKNLLIYLKSNIIDEYLKKSRPEQYNIFIEYKNEYIGIWEKYFQLRFRHTDSIEGIKRDPVLSNLFGRIPYLNNRFPRTGQIGSCGDTAIIFAYDALLECEGSLEKIIYYSCLHEGDSDTVGALALGWFGAYYGTSLNTNLTNDLIKNIEVYNEIKELTNNMDKFGTAYEVISVYFN